MAGYTVCSCSFASGPPAPLMGPGGASGIGQRPSLEVCDRRRGSAASTSQPNAVHPLSQDITAAHIGCSCRFALGRLALLMSPGDAAGIGRRLSL
jgi:hypothetical protein